MVFISEVVICTGVCTLLQNDEKSEPYKELTRIARNIIVKKCYLTTGGGLC
jgi:hypothetical protein